MANSIQYNRSNPETIVAYAQRLLDKSLKDVLGNEIIQTYKGKGKLGQLLEELYFQYKPNSNAEPDFLEAGVELKTSPIKAVAKGYVSKERLVFNIINYLEEYKEEFNTSSFWKKNQLLLLMFYLYEQEKIDLDYIFKIIRLWQFPATDLKIIKDDWEKIIAKIKAGKAHEISEGDTLYLGACTKGANNTTLRKQPFSDEMAMQRAFSLKSKYLNFIIEKSLKNEIITIDYEEYDRILDENYISEQRSSYKRLYLEEIEPVVKDIGEYKKGETFESLVLRKFEPYFNKSEKELVELLHINNSTSKSKFYIISREIIKAVLGISKNKIEEFEKAAIEMKTIRLENSGSLKESMSFAQIQFKDIISEEWEESYWFNTLTKRFFFIVFQKDENGVLKLKKIMFWTMPAADLLIAKNFWLDTKQKIANDDYNNFIKISDKMICHIRPKGTDSKEKMETPSGRMEKKKCYWLNSNYIKGIIS